MKIGEVAKRTGLTEKAIRVYVDNGLVAPTIEQTTHRNSYDFTEENVKELERISYHSLNCMGAIACRAAYEGGEEWLEACKAYMLENLNYLRSFLQTGATLAVTGGTTMREVAHAMPHGTPMNVMVVPARGGIGRALETQANTVASEIARQLGGHHRLMHLPDHLDEQGAKDLLDRTLEAGMARIRPHKEHKSSYVSLVILADTITPEAKQLIKKTRFQKNFWLSLHGWMEYHIAAMECSTQSYFSNSGGKIARKTLEQNFGSRGN